MVSTSTRSPASLLGTVWPILAWYNMPVTSPPRDSYGEVLLFDNPYMLCPLNEPSNINEVVDVSEHGRNPIYDPTNAPDSWS